MMNESQNMCRYLALDTSSSSLTVVAVNGEKVVIRETPDASLRHSVMLMGEADAALSKAGLRPKDCDFFCAVVGPGSFTGIRIGISAAKGFAMGSGAGLVAVTAFDTVACEVDDRNFAVVIDAGRQNFYVCRYTDGIAGDASYETTESVTKLGVPLYGSEELDLPGYTRKTRNLRLATEKHKTEKTDNLTALYIRKSQAEEGRR